MTTKTCTCTSHGHCAACEEQREAHVAKTPSHTPAPWRYQTDENGDNTLIVDKDGKFITDVRVNITASQQANARLIVAAPELLEALKAAREYLSESNEYNDGNRKENTLMNVFESAIAKAEGQSN